MPQVWIIGAAESCDIRPSSPYVSGKHCRLEFDGAQWTLEDLGSKNGTYVNGVRVNGRVAVTRKDSITLGQTVSLSWPEMPSQRSAPGPVSPKNLILPKNGQSIIVGRGTACDVVLAFPMVSARHAKIEHTGSGWLVHDLGSTNGVFVRGHRISGPVVVNSGDIVGFGSFRLVLSADGDQLLERDRRSGWAVEVSHLTADVAGRRVLGDVSLVAKQGEMIGIMGASGAGKSTLLATLVGYEEPSEGRVLVGGVDLHARRDELRGQVGYVPQDDIMHPDLTVWQSLWYSARLRLPRDYSNEEIQRRLEQVIVQLGLEGTEHTRIGNADHRGISGGQRKRVNVAMELITDPPILVLDEPTSGLSSVDALAMLKVLRLLAEDGKTVILTIHQPGVESLKLLHGVAVLSKDESTDNVGTLVWYGPAYPDAAQFFEPTQSGQTMPDAEAILRGLASRPAAEWRDAYRKTPQHKGWVTSRLSDPGSVGAEDEPLRASASDAALQAVVLIQRMLAVKRADGWNTMILLAQAPIIGLLIAGVFGGRIRQPLEPSTWQSVTTAVGMTTFLLALSAVWFGISNSAREFVAERAIYRRERMVGLSQMAYLISKVVVLSVFCVIQCAVLFTVVGLGCGLEGSAAYAVVVLVLAATAGMASGLALSAAARTSEAAAAALPLMILPMVVLGGSVLPLEDLPDVAVYFADLMPSRWGFEGLLCNEAAARPMVDVPTGSGLKRQDVATPWFPDPGWRVRWFVPPAILFALTVLGLYATHAVLAAKRQRRQRGFTG